jgi:hypothetical protein
MSNAAETLEVLVPLQSPASDAELERIQMIDQQVFDEERALHGIQEAAITRCVFDGPQDGESALKESANLYITDRDFRPRYA